MRNKKEIETRLLSNIEEVQIALGDLAEFDDEMFDFLLRVNCSK